MPAMANITVKNVANADVVYVAKVPSAGDKMPAKWTQDAAQPIPGFRPVFTIVSRDNGTKTTRVVDGSIIFPVIETINGRVTQTGTALVTFSGSFPSKLDATLVDECFHQFGGLMSSALIRDVAKTGYAPT